MTLHWWMHWFWVTTLITLYANIGTAAPQNLQNVTVFSEATPNPPRLSERQGRAMYYDKVPVVTAPPTPATNITDNQTETALEPHTENTNISTEITNSTELVHPSVTWTAVNITDNINTTKANETEVVNTTERQNTTDTTKKRNLTRLDAVKDDLSIDSASESRIVTEKPLSLETAYVQTRVPPNVESSRRVIDQDDNGMDTGAIAGISFAALVLVALAGSTAFVLYRRRYLNKPQTLNDKCSNPDSSGYLDDSTIRDNSEEMYSLDNDSFLNSLEAMTIQNYWTDTVKHTKL